MREALGATFTIEVGARLRALVPDMASTSAIVNRALRSSVIPALRDAGFAKVDARNAWRWHEKFVCVFNVRAVGNYFSSVTGWPPGSVGVWLGVYYSFMPSELPVKLDDQGRGLPAEYVCQVRSHLDRKLDQDAVIARLDNPAERRRKDLWWIEADGSNAPEVAGDIALALRERGLPWFSAQFDLAAQLANLERGRDCFVKFDVAAFLARELGDGARLQKYASLAETEGRRIGKTVDRRARYGV